LDVARITRHAVAVRVLAVLSQRYAAVGQHRA